MTVVSIFVDVGKGKLDKRYLRSEQPRKRSDWWSYKENGVDKLKGWKKV